ncbi:amidohydrolase family protein [Desertimonas flava]|uniref:amidohydrolase family protein n=1 Tax=Desertimonas flava TaxID=2064846 RepID=UPI000E340EAE|nr:amidohydrolase family protein [Desertimonas flava]
MSGPDPLVIVSADGHASAPPEVYRPYLDAALRDRYDDLVREDAEHRSVFEALYPLDDGYLELVDGTGAIRSGGLRGAHDVARRLREMDREGIAAELIISNSQLNTMPFFTTVNRPHSHELQAAGARAYNRWIADCLAEGDGRLFAVGYPGPSRDMEAVLRELDWLADHGFSSVPVPDLVLDSDRPPLADPYFDRFWAACADHGFVLSVHAGHGRPQGETLRFLDRVAALTGGGDREAALTALNAEKDSVFSSFDLRPRRVLWELMLAHVFDRFPALRFALTEVRGDWIPATLAWLDSRHAVGDTSIRRKPSEYWQEHCFVGLSFIHLAEVEMRTDIGTENMMFGRDYPHPEGTWPNTLDWLAHALRGVDELDVRAILGGNAIECYGLDQTALAEVGHRIGPTPASLSSRQVADEMLADFQTRGGYLRAAEHVDTTALESAFASDLAAI